MSAQRRAKADSPPNLDAVLIDIVRLAAKNDAAAITRRVRRWVGSPAARREGLSDTLRGEILAALQATPEQTKHTRHTTVLERPAAYAVRQPDDAAPPAEPALAPAARSAIARVIAEYESHDALASRGLAPTRSLLLSGPPGVGKTMTAAWIADQLALPLRPIEPSEIVTSLLGDSARNLTGALREAQEVPCVLLLDEIDAFGKRRDDPHDVGELKRLVTTLLVELDRWPAGKLIIGATNHPGLLDHALERRFEKHIALTAPGAEERATIITTLLSDHEAQIPAGTLQTMLVLTDGATGSRLSAIVRAAVRNTILDGEPLQVALMREALPADPRTLPREARASFARAAGEHAGLPQRTIAQLLGCSHTTVGRLLDPDTIAQAV
ncbi:MAG: AAA family ATPase [Solirubrobacteraceae bacterium]